MAKWINSDGLQVRFGTEEGVNKGVGEYNLLGPSHITEITLELADCPSTGAGGVISDSVNIPAGAFIEKVWTQVVVETTGTNANLDLGLAYQHATTHAITELDYNGLLAAADVFNAGTDIGLITEYSVGTTEVGALVGTTLATTNNRYLLTANYDTAAFTAGTLLIRVYWTKVPTKTDTIP